MGTAWEDIEHTFHNMRTLIRCPIPGCSYNLSIRAMVIHLNDTHGHSREFVADWLESLSIDTSLISQSRGD